MAIETTQTTEKPADGTPAEGAVGAKGSTGAPAESLLAGQEGSTQAQQGTGEKPTGEAKAQEPASEITLKLPEGMDAKTAEPYVALAKKHGFKAEAAQEIFDMALKDREAARGSVEEEIASGTDKMYKEWVESSKADKEFGGADLQKNLGVAQKAVRRFGGDALIKVLNQTGLGNHPEVIRAFFRAGKLISEDSIAGTTGATAEAPLSDTERLKREFPNSPSMWGG